MIFKPNITYEENCPNQAGGGVGGGVGGGGKRRGLGPRNDVLTTCKAVQNPYWPAVFLNGKPRFFSAQKKKYKAGGILRARVFN